jgi:hypothetical protein
MIAEGELPRRPTPERVIAGTLLAILLSGTALWLGPEPHSFAESLGIMAFLGGPFFFILAIYLARHTAEQQERNQLARAALVPMGMGLVSVLLLTAAVVLLPALGLWSFALLFLLFLPSLAGGAGLGLGCLIGTRRERP